MSVLTLEEVNGLKLFDEASCAAVGDALAEKYRSADPFPHIVIDDFVDGDLLCAVLAECPARDGVDFFDRDQERFKYQFHPNICNGPTIKHLFAELNGQAFLTFLEHMTGIKGLVSAPYFAGGWTARDAAGRTSGRSRRFQPARANEAGAPHQCAHLRK